MIGRVVLARSALAAAAAALALTAAGCGRPKWADNQAPTPIPPDAAGAATGSSQSKALSKSDGFSQSKIPPGLSAWVAPLLGKNPRAVFASNGPCMGNTDNVIGKNDLETIIVGWGWDVAARRRVDRVILVNADFVIVGGGDGGVSRPDVPSAVSTVTAGDTGWNARTSLTTGAVDAYGVVGNGKALCPLGHLKF